MNPVVFDLRLQADPLLVAILFGVGALALAVALVVGWVKRRRSRGDNQLPQKKG